VQVEQDFTELNEAVYIHSCCTVAYCRNRILTIQNLAKFKHLGMVVMNKNGMHE
jgi:hypothetical protein